MKKDLLELIKQDLKHLTIESCFSKKFPEIYNNILLWNYPQKFKFNQKLYHYIYDDINFLIGICPVCGKRCSFERFGIGYSKTCSISCADILKSKNHSKERKEEIKRKKQQTYQQKSDEEKLLYSKSQKELYNNKSDIEKKKLAIQHSESMKNRSDKAKKKTSKIISSNSKDMWRKKSKEDIEKKVIKSKNTEIYNYRKDNNIWDLSDDDVWKLCIKYHHSPKRSLIIYDGLCFDSNWEIIFYKYHKSLNHNIIYHPNIYINYEYNDKNHIYQPDFIIDNQLYEIKGDHFFDGDKMINPYDRTQDDLYEAKHQCMKNNNIKIIRFDDIKKMEVLI